MGRPTVLMLVRPREVLIQGCEERFDVIRLWEFDDPKTMLAEHGSRVTAVTTAAGKAVDQDLLNRLPNLQIVANSSVGCDAIDVEEAARRGIVVTNTAGSLDDEVADTAMGLLVMTARQLPQAERYLRARRWSDGPFPLSAARLSGRTLGIVGLGRIGEKIAIRGEAFGLEIAYHSRHRKNRPYRFFPTLLEMATEVDTLMIVVPGGDTTRHLIDSEVLAALGSDGILINVARGSVVNQKALITALQSHVIMGAGLDVYEDEPHVPQSLLDCENAVLLPHVGSASVATRDAMARLCLDNLSSWFDTGRPLTPVTMTKATR